MLANYTEYQTGGRETVAEVTRQHAALANARFTRELLDVLPQPLVVLNRFRQIVLANRPALALIGELDHFVGQRPGEALQCVHAWESGSGCGTSGSCSGCGMFTTILAGLDGREESADCRFTRSDGAVTQSYDLRVWSRPLIHDDENFVLFVINDISHEKRRFALERIFFHDVMNALGSVRGCVDLLRDYPKAAKDDLLLLLDAATRQAIDEIVAQRTLVMAENRELQVHCELIGAATFVHETAALMQRHDVAEEKGIDVAIVDDELHLQSDSTLLRRILINMLKNALEATPAGKAVTIGVRAEQGEIVFFVHNCAVIPEEHQSHIFQRSFSTKGMGRGLGTYSMQLLSGYLAAKVAFVSRIGAGTTFTLTCPVMPPAEKQPVASARG